MSLTIRRMIICSVTVDSPKHYPAYRTPVQCLMQDEPRTLIPKPTHYAVIDDSPDPDLDCTLQMSLQKVFMTMQVTLCFVTPATLVVHSRPHAPRGQSGLVVMLVLYGLMLTLQTLSLALHS